MNFGEHSPEDVTAALSSSDKKIMTPHEGDHKVISTFFLANFEVVFLSHLKELFSVMSLFL